MSDTLDERVVKLEFDNSKFEKNVKQTQKSLKQLDKQLAFKEGSEGIERVEASFSRFQIVAFTIISRLTNKLIDLGVTLVKSLSVDNISAGWTKFGEKSVSVATMAAQKIKIAGKEIDDYAEKMNVINEQLEKLNWFTDETSYNFTDMVNNIGKFTAAGRSLDESVNAMMGIANWAALSGQNAVTASRAMYQLSQALGKGYVQLMDWKSIQNANMDTEEFREKAVEAAIAIGELTKEGNTFITKTGKRFTLAEFTESLSSKWFTTDVLLNTLENYSSAVEKLFEICEEEGITATEAMARYGDELDIFGVKAFKAAQEARTFADVMASVKDAVSTGWMNTAEKIFGGYDESKILWTELANQLYDVFAEGGNFRNEVLGLWRDLGGNKKVFGEHGSANQGAFWNVYDSIVAVRNLIKEAWSDVFSSSSFSETTERAQEIAEKLNNITERIREFTNRIRKSVEENLKLRLIFQGLFNILRMGLVVLSGARYALSPLVYMLKDIISYLVDKLAAIGLNMNKLRKYVSNIENVSRKLNSVITHIMESIDPRGVLESLFKIVGMLVRELSNYHPIEYAVSLLKDFSDALKNGGGTAEDFQSIFKGVASILEMVSRLLIDVAKVIRAYIVPVIAFVIRTLNYLTGFISGVLIKILSFVGNFFSELNKLLNTGQWNLSSVSASVTDFVDNLGKNLQKLKPLLESIARLGASIINLIILLPNVLNKLSKAITGRGIVDNFKNIFDKITEFFVKFRDSLDSKEFDPNEGVFAPVTALARGMASFLKGIVAILGPLVTIVGQALNLLGVILQAIGDMLNGFIAVFKGDQAKNVMDYLVRIILILGGVVVALYLISNMFYTIVGLVKGISYLITNVADAIYAIGNSFVLNAISSIITSIAYALLSLAAVIAVIANIPEDGLIRAISVVGGFLALIGLLIAVLLKMNKSVASGVRDLSISRKGLKGSFSYITTILEQVSMFLFSVSASLIAFSIAVSILSKLNPSEAWSGASILLIFMTTITAIIIALTKFGPRDFNTKSMDKETKSLKKAIKLIGVMSVACLSISKAISKLGGMDPSRMWMGIAGFITVLAAITAMMVAINLSMKKGITEADARLAAMGSLFRAVSLLMLSLSAVIAVLAAVSVERAWIGISQIVTLLAALMLMCISLSNFATKGVFDYKKAGSFFIGMSLALLSMSGSIAILASIETSKAWMSILQITAILAVLTTMCIALSRLAGNSSFDFKMASAFFISMSIMLLTLSGVIAIFNKFDSSKTWNSIGQIMAILAGFTVMSIAFGRLVKNRIDAAAFKSLLIGITLVLLSMTGVIVIMNTMNPAAVWSSIGGILAIIAGFTFMMTAIMNVRANSKRVKQALILMVAATAQMAAIAASILILRNVPWQTILAAAGAISAAILAFSAAMVILSAAKIDVKNLITFSLGIVLMTAAMIPFILALKLMESISLTTIATGGLMLAATIILLAAASKLLGPSVVYILALSGAVLMLGVGMLLATMSLMTFADSITGSMETIVANSEVIKSALSSIGSILISALVGGLTELFSSLNELAPQVIELVKTLINGVVEILEDDGNRIIEVIVDLVTTLAHSLAEHAPVLIESIGKIIFELLKWLKANIKQLANDIIDVLVEIIHVLVDRIPDIVLELRYFLIQLINAIFDNIGPVLEVLVKRAFGFLSEFIPMLIGELMKFTGVIVNAVLVLFANVIKLTIVSLGTLGKLMLDLLAGIILLVVQISAGLSNVLFQAFRTMLYNAFYVLSEVLKSMVSDVPKMIGGVLGKMLGGIVSYLGDMVNTYLGGLFGFGDTLKGWGEDIANAANDTFDKSILNGSNVVSALNTARTNISGTITSISSAVTDDVQEGVSAVNDALQSSLEALGMKVEDNTENVGQKVENAVIGSYDSVGKNVYEGGLSIGDNLMSGVSEGIENNNNKVVKSSNKAALLAEEAMKKQAEIHSPSKVFAEIGYYMMEGLSLGMTDGSIDTTNTAINVMNDTLMAVKAAAESDIDDEIVIRPVMDLSDIANGAQSISSIMSNISRGRVSVSGVLADSVQRRTNEKLATHDTSSQNGPTVVNNETYNPVFNITSNDPEEVAREVDIRLQRMHVQSNLAKGGAR